MKKSIYYSTIFALLISNSVYAEGWCEFDYYTVVTHGTKTNNVHLNGKLKEQSNSTWIMISDGTTGNMNVSLALAAQMAGKKLSIYLDDAAHTCENFPSWAGVGKLRHLKVL
ncbi:hypothetical protein [Colwellia psychrerythraea]|uniref:Lipoprotein n=1 Tax=Colwellia psychrerythraea TaxID=28229 RepID=A0A099KNF2_COLPS|nr:hypothetical protein [Colwellia psychrerythraea]KGJ91760.1 hypothetical protein GAB14E_3242 [Colwellia psychrerythraea]